MPPIITVGSFASLWYLIAQANGLSSNQNLLA
jgi:hypothetical protein